jgi:hypothetical protein
MKQLNSISDIDSDTAEGRALLAALAIITTESRTSQTPYEVLADINALSDKMYSPKPKEVHGAIFHPTLGPTGHGDICMSDADPGL